MSLAPMKLLPFIFILLFSFSATAEELDLYGEDDIIEEEGTEQIEIKDELTPAQQKQYLQQAKTHLKNKEYKQAREILFQIEKYEIAEVYYQIGIVFNRGLSIKKNQKEAAIFFLRAANLGHLQSQYNIAYMYERGLGTDVKGKEAANWYTKAAEQGMKKAQLKLGDLYYDGIGVSRDLNKAAFWYKKVADKGSLVGKKLYEKVQYDIKKGR